MELSLEQPDRRRLGIAHQKRMVGVAHPTTYALPKLWPSLLLCGLAALWIDLTGIHAEQHADSLLPVLVSLYRWTPFYWGLDRIGMLAPLITLPIKHPLANLLAQDALYIFGSLAGLIMLARYVLRDATYPLVGMLCIAAFVGLTPSYYRFHLLIDTQYGLWLSLGLGGLLLLEANSQGRISLLRRIGAIVLLALAHWCYCTTSLFLGPLVLLRWLFFRGVPAHSRTRMLFAEVAASLASLAFAFAVGLLLMRLSPVSSTNFGTLPIRAWPETACQLLRTTWENLAPQRWPLVCSAATMLGLLLTWRARTWPALLTAWRAGAVLLGAAFLIALFMATRQWVPINSYRIRFLFIPALFTQAALVALAVAACAGRWPRVVARLHVLIGAAFILVAIGGSLGGPSVAKVRSSLTRRELASDLEGHPTVIRSDDVLATRSTHIAGNYWRVWPAVFAANLKLYEQGEQRVIWGLTLRSEPTSAFWKAVPRSETRIAVFAQGDDEANKFLASFGYLPLVACEQRASITVLEPAEYAAQMPRQNNAKFLAAAGSGHYGRIRSEDPSHAL
jgi:hypothetical protein